METKKAAADLNIIDFCLYLLPVIGIWLLWRHRYEFRPVHLWCGTCFGIMSTVVIVMDIVKIL